MNTINNEEHINNIKQMVDGKIPQKYKENNNLTKYISDVHKYNDTYSEVNSMSSNELEYMIIFYTTQLNSTNRHYALKSIFTYMISLLTAIVALYAAILPYIDKDSIPSFFITVTNFAIFFIFVIIFAIVVVTLLYNKKMKKYEYILSILQNEQTRRTKPQTNRQQQKRNQCNRNKK